MINKQKETGELSTTFPRNTTCSTCDIFDYRCQQLEQELTETKEELRIVTEQLQCAAAQKYHLQEKLCRFEVLGQVLSYITTITIMHNHIIMHAEMCFT